MELSFRDNIIFFISDFFITLLRRTPKDVILLNHHLCDISHILAFWSPAEESDNKIWNVKIILSLKDSSLFFHKKKKLGNYNHKMKSESNLSKCRKLEISQSHKFPMNLGWAEIWPIFFINPRNKFFFKLNKNLQKS